jgi:HemX protein
MTGWLHFAALMLYGVATALLGVSFARSDQRLPRLAGFVLAAGLTVHAAGLAAYVSLRGELPLVGLGPSVSTLGFLVGLGTLIASTFGHARTVGLVLVPLVALLTGIAVGVRVEPAGEPIAFRGAWFALHVVFAFIGYAGFTVAFAAGLMYLLQFRQLKGKHFGAVFRFFPPLDTLDRLGRSGLLLGFPFLTIAVLVGWAWSSAFAGGAPGDLKLVWVFLSWFVFLAALLARSGGSRRSEVGAAASVVGFAIVVLLYVVVRVQASHAGAFL